MHFGFHKSLKNQIERPKYFQASIYNHDLYLFSDQKVTVTIKAATVYGARHGLETFTQLITADRPDYSKQERCGLRIVSGARIKDYPAYKHRGLVLDTSRHFIPMKDIKRTIDGMAAAKLNVFHWHVTDSHSFPFESTRVPQFTRYVFYSISFMKL